MWLHISVAALLLQGAQASQPRLAGSPRSSGAVTDAASNVVLRFLSTWRTAWLESIDGRTYGNAEVRLRDVHCHWDGSYGSNHGPLGYYQPPSLIHRSSRRSMCPDWLPTDERTPADERLERDASIAPAWRDRVRVARAALLDSLAILAARHPGDAWITGQRVRFLVDQGTSADAIEVARNCSANGVWCAQLTGFALRSAGDFARADSAFDAAAAAMTPEKRCEWTNTRLLLDPDERSAYDRLNCDERAAANERLWWVSTALFSDSIDGRRSEHFSRKVLVQLHAALSWDERYDWRSQFGAEAVSEMLIRYGWPAFSAFGGAFEEQAHANWMSFYDSTRTATAEYPRDRLHLVPEWRGVADPFHAPANAWQINMPALTDDDEPAGQWWPAEHYARAAGAIVQVSEQTVLLRRDADVLLATASELKSTAAVLVRSTAPHTVERVPHQTFSNATSTVLTARIPATPAIVGTELLGRQSGELSARTRLGITPPAPLTALRPGEAAISDPVFIATDDTLPSDPDDALRRMLGSTRVRGTKLGVYWETYGYSAGDSVDVAIVIERRVALSKLRRLGMMLRIAHGLDQSVAVRWTEPQAGHDSWTIPGVVPIQARSIRVDLSRVEPGRYTIRVLVARHGGLPISSSRELVLEGK